MKNIKVWLIVITVTALIVLPVSVGAQEEDDRERLRFGPRLGFSLDPDQFVVGVKSVLGEVVNPFRFAPSIDAGFGDDVTTVTINTDFRLPVLSPPKSPSGFYVSAGPTFALVYPEQGDSDLEIGLSLNGGFRVRMGERNYYTLEGRYGIDDIPEWKILLGILF